MQDTTSELTRAEWEDKGRAERLLEEAERRRNAKLGRLRFHHYLRTGEYPPDDENGGEA